MRARGCGVRVSGCVCRCQVFVCSCVSEMLGERILCFSAQKVITGLGLTLIGVEIQSQLVDFPFDSPIAPKVVNSSKLM